ncbi:MAG: efflux RND transporter periplasmic adaptor subunit [Leptolyngbyaceae cyanobacterium SM1_1_3]|nr:efflux RND transporter periplasmic adaptor subunit [Leptolyngbyaceae cyanobacterium SM1_1_3]NJN01154.1 efflux RND transporter periplasmic adaptor subunit [Leptolyngbyaceae cyanobacterium RM1_1_2]
MLIGLGLGLAIAFLGSRLLPGDRNRAQESAPADVAAQSVAAETAQSATISRTLKTTGTVEAYDLLQVAPQVSSLQIQQVLVREGDRVTAGQTLAVLDDATLQAQLRQAQAEIAAAQAQVTQQRAALAQAQAEQAEARQNLQRYQNLADRGAISQEELSSRTTQSLTANESVRVAVANIESAEANVRSQQASLEGLQTQLAQTTVSAPAAGTIAERSATVGDTTSTGTPLFTLIQDDQLELAAEIPQTQLAQIAVGAPVAITSDSDERIQLTGSIREIEPLVDAESRTAIVKISLPSSSLLRPGMFLSAAIVTATAQGLTVPAAAVVPQSDGQYQVFVVQADGTAQAQTVKIGDRLPDTAAQPARVEILEGLQIGDRVVTQGAGYVQSGDRVEVVPELE